MEIWIVVCPTKPKFTRAFSTERKAQAYSEVTHRVVAPCEIVKSYVNKASRYEQQEQA